MALLDGNAIREAFARLGEKLRLNRNVEILIVGGAAGVLTGQLPAAWTTADVDTIHCWLPEDREAVLDAASAIVGELSLPANWVNDWAGLFGWTLPEDWQSRRVLVGTYGHLRVFAVGRIALIRMKFLAHRERDLEHLMQMNVDASELEWVRHYLDNLAQRYPVEQNPSEAGQIEMARQYVEGWLVP